MKISKKMRTPLKTEERLNYSMIFGGKMRTFEKVIITFSPFDNGECISAAEIDRLGLIVREEVLNTNHPLLIGEVEVLKALHRIRIMDLFDKGVISESYLKSWRSSWSKELSLEDSIRIKEYFKSLPLPDKKKRED